MLGKNRSTALLAILLVFTLYQIEEAAGKMPRPFLRQPDINGEFVVFTSEADLWLASLSTGIARRITSHPGVETYARFSPNGMSWPCRSKV